MVDNETAILWTSLAIYEYLDGDVVCALLSRKGSVWSWGFRKDKNSRKKCYNRMKSRKERVLRLLKRLARAARLERATCGFVVRRSIQLSYGRSLIISNIYNFLSFFFLDRWCENWCGSIQDFNRFFLMLRCRV